jgi:hypothetical protein
LTTLRLVQAGTPVFFAPGLPPGRAVGDLDGCADGTAEVEGFAVPLVGAGVGTGFPVWGIAPVLRKGFVCDIGAHSPRAHAGEMSARVTMKTEPTTMRSDTATKPPRTKPGAA